nr:GrpB family protein [Rhizobium leguminosarum]
MIAIDHIGSTAVPGRSAKPLIDIDVAPPSREHA